MICDTVVGKDIIDRHGIRQGNLFEAVIEFLCSNIGSYVSANKIADTLKSNGYSKVTHDTIGNYLDFVCDAYLFYKAQRYDIKGRHYLKTLNKYYIADLGIRNSKLNYRQIEITHSLENIIYLDLIRRGYIVDIGKNNVKEIDFVARDDKNLYYIQVAYSIAEEKTYNTLNLDETLNAEEIEHDFSNYEENDDQIVYAIGDNTNFVGIIVAGKNSHIKPGEGGLIFQFKSKGQCLYISFCQSIIKSDDNYDGYFISENQKIKIDVI